MSNPHIGSFLGDFLEGIGMTKVDLAKKLETSRTALDRLLDGSNTSVSLYSLAKATEVINKRLKINLV